MNRRQVAGSLRRLAHRARRSLPAHPAHLHLGDAATAVAAGNTDGAQRHLNGAIASLAPMHLNRLGYHSDLEHTKAKSLMHLAHRHQLLTKDLSGALEPEPAALANRQRGIELARQAVGL